METPREMREKLVERANGDPDFRARLLDDPKGVIEKELDVSLPKWLSVHVHEDSATSAHLVLPPDGALSDDDLREVTGGYSWEDFKSGKGVLDW